MMSGSLHFFRRLAIVMALCGAFAGLTAGSALARVFVGIGIPFYGPGYYPPPVYYPPPPAYFPPPVYYPPPPVYYPPPQTYTPAPAPRASGAGQSCYAGPYVCPMDRPAPTGASCYCLGNAGQRVSGRVN
ncbi:MAG TPA: hypothetical protein DDZ81_10280 [Acetobacteraceae bacterium]|jgi:hypothetical protein|nr:hypothetical protein [Acetobacteraceae bacterium]